MEIYCFNVWENEAFPLLLIYFKQIRKVPRNTQYNMNVFTKK